MLSLCFSILRVSSVLPLPVPISLDYTTFKASMQTKVNYLKSRKSKGDSQQYSHTSSGAYQMCCLCPLQKLWSNSQTTLRTSSKYKDFSGEMSSFTKHIWDTSMIAVTKCKAGLRPLQVAPELSGPLHLQCRSSFHSQEQLTCFPEKKPNIKM